MDLLENAPSTKSCSEVSDSLSIFSSSDIDDVEHIYDQAQNQEATHEGINIEDFKQMDRGLLLFCLNSMVDNGLFFASIASVDNLLVVRFNFE